MPIHDAPKRCKIKSKFWRSPSSLHSWCLLGQRPIPGVTCGNCKENIPRIQIEGFDEGLKKGIQDQKKKQVDKITIGVETKSCKHCDRVERREGFKIELDRKDRNTIELTHQCSNCLNYVEYHDWYCSRCGCYLKGYQVNRE